MRKEPYKYKSAKSDGTKSLMIRFDYDYKKEMVRDLAFDKVARVMGVGKIIKVITEALTLTLVHPESGNCAIYLRL